MKSFLSTLLSGCFLLLQLPLLAQGDWEVPRTGSGVADLQGVWTSATVTTLERDPVLGDRLVVDVEEALRLEQTAALNVLTNADNAPSDPDRLPPTDGNTDAGYNAFWIDPGTKIAEISGEYRTSFIVDPANIYRAAGAFRSCVGPSQMVCPVPRFAMLFKRGFCGSSTLESF